MRFTLFAVVAIAACASTPSPDTTAAPRAQTIRAEGLGSITVAPVTDASKAVLSSPIEDVWMQMPAVYDSLGIPKTLIDTKRYLISSQGFKIRQRLGRTPLSRFIDCGQTQIGQNADSYDVYLTVTSQLRTDPPRTILSSTVEAMAKPLSFNQEYSRCSSRGLLESRIADATKSRLPR